MGPPRRSSGRSAGGRPPLLPFSFSVSSRSMSDRGDFRCKRGAYRFRNGGEHSAELPVFPWPSGLHRGRLRDDRPPGSRLAGWEPDRLKTQWIVPFRRAGIKPCAAGSGPARSPGAGERGAARRRRRCTGSSTGRRVSGWGWPAEAGGRRDRSGRRSVPGPSLGGRRRAWIGRKTSMNSRCAWLDARRRGRRTRRRGRGAERWGRGAGRRGREPGRPGRSRGCRGRVGRIRAHGDDRRFVLGRCRSRRFRRSWPPRGRFQPRQGRCGLGGGVRRLGGGGKRPGGGVRRLGGGGNRLGGGGRRLGGGGNRLGESGKRLGGGGRRLAGGGKRPGGGGKRLGGGPSGVADPRPPTTPGCRPAAGGRTRPPRRRTRRAPPRG